MRHISRFMSGLVLTVISSACILLVYLLLRAFGWHSLIVVPILSVGYAVGYVIDKLGLLDY